MSISNYLEDRLLNLVLRNTTFPAISAVWGSLHTGDPTETGTGSPLSSCPRFAVAFKAAASATAELDSTASVVTSGAGIITHIGLWDASDTGTGNHLWNGALTASKVVNAGDTITIATASGSLAVTLA